MITLYRNGKKIRFLLWLLITTSVMLGFPVIKFGLFVLEFGVWKDYITGNTQISTPSMLFPIALLLVLLLFPLARSKHFFTFLLIIPTIFLIVVVWDLFIFFIIDPITCLTLLIPFVAVWGVLIYVSAISKQNTRQPK